MLNGEKVEPELFGGTLMAFNLEPGEYELAMAYTPAGSSAGIIVTVVSVAVFVVLIIFRRKKGNSVVLPEEKTEHQIQMEVSQVNKP